jgi:hypothetical protein
VIQTTPKEEQKVVLKKLKEEERRKMALLGEQYEQTIAEMLQKQSVSHQAWRLVLLVRNRDVRWRCWGSSMSRPSLRCCRNSR